MPIAVTNQGSERLNRQMIVNAYVSDATSGEVTLLAADANYVNDLISLVIINTVATAQTASIRSTTGGTVLFTVPLPSIVGGVVSLDFGGGGPVAFWKQAAVNTNWTFQNTNATGTVYIATFRKSAP